MNHPMTTLPNGHLVIGRRSDNGLIIIQMRNGNELLASLEANLPAARWILTQLTREVVAIERETEQASKGRDGGSEK